MGERGGRRSSLSLSLFGPFFSCSLYYGTVVLAREAFGG